MTLTVNLFIIILTCLISIAGFSNYGIIRSLAHSPTMETNNKQWYRLVSSGFVHGDYFHLFVNMFVLYGFGNFVEQAFRTIHGEIAGSVVYACFYIFMIILANLPTFAKHKNNFRYSSIGASGATSAVLFSYILFRPWSILELYLFIPIPAIVFGILYLWYSSYASKNLNDNIDHDAHFYGAVAGFVFTALMKKELIFHFINELTSILR